MLPFKIRRSKPISERLSCGFIKQSLWQRGKHRQWQDLFLIRGQYKCQFTFDYKDMDPYNQNKAIRKQASKKNSCL